MIFGVGGPLGDCFVSGCSQQGGCRGAIRCTQPPHFAAWQHRSQLPCDPCEIGTLRRAGVVWQARGSQGDCTDTDDLIFLEECCIGSTFHPCFLSFNSSPYRMPAPTRRMCPCVHICMMFCRLQVFREGSMSGRIVQSVHLKAND